MADANLSPFSRLPGYGHSPSSREYAKVQPPYPTRTGVWSFYIHQIICEEGTAVSEVIASDGDQAGRVIAFRTVTNGKITRQGSFDHLWSADHRRRGGRMTGAAMAVAATAKAGSSRAVGRLLRDAR